MTDSRSLFTFSKERVPTEPRQERVIDIVGLEQPVGPAATYSIEVACNNCNFRGKVQIPKGTPVAGSLCPNCGCQTVVKSLPTTPPGTNLPTIREALAEHIRRGPGPRPDIRYFQHTLLATGQPNRNGDVLADGSFAHGHIIGSWDRNYGVAPAGPPRTVGVTTDMDGSVRPIVEGEQAIGTIDLEAVRGDGKVEVTPQPARVPGDMRALANAADRNMLSMNTLMEHLGLPRSLLPGDRPAEVPRIEPGDSAILNAALNGPR